MTQEEIYKKLNGTKVFVGSPDISAKVQQKLFELGYVWADYSKTVSKGAFPVIYIADNKITWSDNYKMYYHDERPAIKASEILNMELDKEPEFKPKDWVLVRDSYSDYWDLHIFAYIGRDKKRPYTTLGGEAWIQCIPYEGNEELLGTTNEPKK